MVRKAKRPAAFATGLLISLRAGLDTGFMLRLPSVFASGLGPGHHAREGWHLPIAPVLSHRSLPSALPRIFVRTTGPRVLEFRVQITSNDNFRRVLPRRRSA